MKGKMPPMKGPKKTAKKGGPGDKKISTASNVKSKTGMKPDKYKNPYA